VISALGGIAGIGIGAAGSAVLEKLTAWNMPLDVRGSVISLAVAAAVGFIFGAGPAIRASLLQPSAALASE
jgi:putative ABC transport system permease protein